MKKLYPLLAALLLAVLLCACTSEKPTGQTTAAPVSVVTVKEITPENVAQQMALLMPQAEKITGYMKLGQIQVGEYDYDTAYTDSENGCKYVPVADESLNTIAKAKALCESCFTAEYCQANLYGVFEGPYELYKEIDGVLCLNVDAGGGGGDTYITQTARIVSQSDSDTLVSMDCRDSYEGEYIAYITFRLVDGTYKISDIKTTEG